MHALSRLGWEDSVTPELRPFFQENGLFASVPPADSRQVVIIANPFMPELLLGTTLVITHPACSEKRTQVIIPGDGHIDGLIKVRLWKDSRREREKAGLASRVPMRYQHSVAPLATSEVQLINPDAVGDSDTSLSTQHFVSSSVSYLPEAFGRPKLDGTDRKLFDFYIVAICSGRTVIPTSNLYLHQFAPMVATDECVKHSVLSLAASYVLDFERHEKLIARANLHQKRAIELIGRALNDDATYSPGKEDAVLASIALLQHNEGINLGAEASPEPSPPWWKAMQTAEHLLAISDPGYHFQDPLNVQCSRARFEIANRVGLFSIISYTVSPIEKVAEKCDYPWLLHGTEREQRQIIGTTGFCSKLMHAFAQITHLSGRHLRNPSSVVIPAVGRELEKKLRNLWQWSDLSEGYSTSEELLASCVLDERGLVTTPTKVTELVGESYAAAAQLYLQCRLFRRPRDHPDVLEPRSRLMKCIAWTPVTGPLFTAQAPLHAAFIGGLVAWDHDDREVIRGYFEPIIANSRGVSDKHSVPAIIALIVNAEQCQALACRPASLGLAGCGQWRSSAWIQ